MKRFIKPILIILVVILVIILVGPYFLVGGIFSDSFGEPITTPEVLTKSMENYPDLVLEETRSIEFDETEMVSYYYTSESPQEAKANIVFAHGLGGGTNSYLDLIAYFVEQGFNVIAFDNVGHDQTAEASDGQGVQSLGKGVNGADAMLQEVTENPEVYGNLPLLGWGHSWGAFSLGSLLEDYSEIAAAVLVAPFNSSEDFMAYETDQVASPGLGDLLRQYYSMYEQTNYSDLAIKTVTSSLQASDVPTQIYMSSDDSIVVPEIGQDIFTTELAETPNVDLILDDNRGHSYMYYDDESRENLESMEQAFMEDNSAVTQAEFEAAGTLDEEYLGQMVEFYNNQLGE